MQERKKILYICGSINQTSQMHQISEQLPEYDHYFTPYYADGYVEWARKYNMLEFSILGNKLIRRSFQYLQEHNLQVDYKGRQHDYDLILTCSDLIIPENIRRKKVILVQEGMTDPEGITYYLVKYLRLPRYLASTSTTGLSHKYDYFCVASNGYKKLFSRKGVRPESIIVTGIPNFDNCKQYYDNNFPYKNYVLVATTDMRETFRYENRKKFIRYCQDIADGRQLIFKLHPNENARRGAQEIKEYAPEALVYSTGDTNHMIANCDVLITRFSSVVYVGLALGKQVYSDFPMEDLIELTPDQNNGTSAVNIAGVARDLLNGDLVPRDKTRRFESIALRKRLRRVPAYARYFRRSVRKPYAKAPAKSWAVRRRKHQE